MFEQGIIPTDRWVRRAAGKIAGFAGFFAIVALTAALLTACSSPSASGNEQNRTVENNPEENRNGGAPTVPAIPAGVELFAANCSACHGAAGEGQPNWHIEKADGTLPAPPLNGDGHTWHHGDGLLYRIVSQGGALPEYPSFKSGMPAFGDRLTHQEIIEVLTYVKSLWGDKEKRGLSIRESQAIVSEQDPFPVGGE